MVPIDLTMPGLSGLESVSEIQKMHFFEAES
jgi:hypothetical protein